MFFYHFLLLLFLSTSTHSYVEEEECEDDASEFFMSSAWSPSCDVTCESLFGKKREPSCNKAVYPRCICRPGFVRQEIMGKCIHLTECPNAPK